MNETRTSLQGGTISGTGGPAAARPSGSSPSGGASGPTGAVEQTKEKAGQALHQAQEKAGQLVGQAEQQTKPRLESQKERAAEQLGTVAQALRQSGQQLRQQQQGPLAQVADKGADQAERLAGYLRQKEVGQLVDDVEQLARRQPALFLGGAFALGMLGARFLKSSTPQSGGSGGASPHDGHAPQGSPATGQVGQEPPG